MAYTFDAFLDAIGDNRYGDDALLAKLLDRYAGASRARDADLSRFGARVAGPLARLAENLSLGRRDDLPPAPVEKADLRRALELADGVADGALRQVEARGGGREAARLHDGVEGAEMREIERRHK